MVQVLRGEGDAAASTVHTEEADESGYESKGRWKGHRGTADGTGGVAGAAAPSASATAAGPGQLTASTYSMQHFLFSFF